MSKHLPQVYRHNRKWLLLAFTFCSFGSFSFLSPAVMAQSVTDLNNEFQGHQVHFSISESQKIDNDTLTIVFSKVTQGRSAQIVTNEINLKMQSALAALEKSPEISRQTSQYNIRPVYNKKQIISHWMGSQNLTVTLENQPDLIKILTELQPYLTYQSMQFSVSVERKTEIMNQLTIKAIKTFQKQAALIAQGFNTQDYRILETRINTPNTQPMARSYASNRMLTSESMAPPALSAGETRLKVEISGTLRLAN